MANRENLQNIENKKFIKFLTQQSNPYGIPVKPKLDKAGVFISGEYNEFCKWKNFEKEYCTPRRNTVIVVVERAIQTIKNLIVANLKDDFCLTECASRAKK